MRSLGKSDFAGLVTYITDAQGQTERLGEIAVTNCQAATLPAVIGEVLATQRLNTRAEGDKIFHLLVSFRPGERPSADTLKAVEARLCAGLGYGEHQRVSAVHRDTDNLHIHIAINKIHPTRHTLHEPFQSYRILAELCAVLERDYGLEKDNHQPKRSIAEGRAADLERHAGVESLVGWIRRVCLAELRGASSWAALDRVLRESGLALRARGNGLIVETAGGVRVKASTIARELSKPALEARLGPFEGSPERQAPPPVKRRYAKAPKRLRLDTVELYARYQAEQKHLTAARTEALGKARRRKARAVEEAKRSNRLRRATIKVLDSTGLSKKVLYAQASGALRERLAATHSQYAKARARLYQGFQRRTWADWLQHEAIKGDATALAALRAREAAQGLKGNTVSGRGEARPGHAPVQDSITKQGTIIFRLGASAVRDDGDKLQVSRGATREGIQAAVRLAMERYGDQITVNGTAAFKAQVIRAAVDAQLPVTFADAALERRRQHLLNTERAHEQAERAPERGGADRGGPGGLGASPAAENTLARAGVGAGRDQRPGRAGRHAAGHDRKPHTGRPGRVPPPEGRNRLRALSQLGVVRIGGGSEVLLPGDVPRHLEQQGAEPDNPLRRDVPRAGRLAAEQLAAADAYIAEREQKRLNGFDINKHARYNDERGPLAYAGTRHIAGHALALLRRADAILVLPIDRGSARRLKRVALGDPVTVTATGAIRTSKGRGR